MAKKNGEYWNERFGLLNENLLNKGDAFQANMAAAYSAAANNIQKEIEVFYSRFADNNKLTLTEAKKLLNSDERKAFQMDLQEYIRKGKENSLDQRWIKELENASNIHRIDRLKALQMQMRQQVEVLEAVKDKGLKKALGGIYEEGYYKTAYEIQKGLGVGAPFATLDTNRIEKVLAKPWAPDGMNFSERIWGQDRTRLIHELETKLTQSIIRGEGPDKVIKEIQKTMNVSRSAASRLVMTESAFFASAAQLDSYKRLGVEKYQVIAALDKTTCGACGHMDKQEPLNIKDFKIGVTAPPFHPNCRCTTVPYFDDEYTQGEERAARGEDGKTEMVPADMNYTKWREKFVKPIDSSSNANDNINKRENAGNKFDIEKELNIIKGILDDVPDDMRMYLEYQLDKNNFIIDKNHNKPFGYDAKNSKIKINPNHLYWNNYDTTEAIIHEIGHKVDFEVTLTINNTDFVIEIEKATTKVLSNIAKYEGILKNDKMAGNMAISDIFSAISKSKVHGDYYHDISYYANKNNQIYEVAANLFQVFCSGNTEAINLLRTEFPELCSVFIQAFN